MKYLNNELHIEISDLVAAGFAENNIYKGVSEGYSTLLCMKEAGRLLFPFSSLGARYKDALNKHFNNVYEYAAKQPIKKLVVKDLKAEAFYYEYRYEEDKILSAEHVRKYTDAASWLNMLIKANADKKTIKKTLGLTIDQFYTHVCDLIKVEAIDLPTSYQRLRNKMQEYEQAGEAAYSTLIDWRFGNKLAAKIKDDVSEALLLKYIEHHNKFDDEQVARFYNAAAVPLGYKAIDQSTVGVHRRKNWSRVQMSREGNAAFYDKYSLSIKQHRASCPLARLENDDNDLDMYFWQEEVRKGKKEINYYKRVKMIVITDSGVGDYPLGWAYGDTVSIELVRAAWLDAMHHIHELTGGWYLPHQIKNDRWALSSLRPFYESISLNYKDNVQGSKRNRYIEQSFGKKWHKDLKEIALLNYAGYNITAGQKINRDALQTNLKNMPHISEAPGYISLFIEKIRSRKNDAGTSLKEQWKQKFFESEISQERQISFAKMLELFGTKHVVPSAANPVLPNTITNEGVVATLCGQEQTYDVPEELSRLHIGKKVQVIYSALDTSRVLITDNETIRFVSQTTYITPSAAVDHTSETERIFFAKMAQKKRLVQWVSEQREKRNQVLEMAGIDAYSLLQAGLLTKEIKQDAENFIQQANNTKAALAEETTAHESLHFEYLKNKININQFLD